MISSVRSLRRAGARFFSRDKEEKRGIETFMTYREFAEYRLTACIDCLQQKDYTRFLMHQKKMRGLRFGFKHSDALFQRFCAEYTSHLGKLSERQFSDSLQNFYHIGVKDLNLYEKTYSYVRQNIQFMSYNGLLAAFEFWNDNKMFGYQMEIEEYFKRDLFQKTRQVQSRLSIEDCVKVSFLFEDWKVPVL